LLDGRRGAAYIWRMGTVDSRVFRSGKGEAVGLPEEIAYGEDIEVTITRLGDRLTIEPKRAKTVADFIALVRRMGPAADGVQARDPVEPPERLGL